MFQFIECNDTLPKSICLDCWIKTKYFHEFYNAVAKAKTAYLTNIVRNEEPKFAEVKCDSSEYNFDIPSVKVEHIIDEDNRFATECATQRNPDSVGNESNNQLNRLGFANCDDNDEEDECNENVCEEFASEYVPIINSNLSPNATAKLALQIVEQPTKSATDEFMKLIPNYFDMICEICKYEFKSLNDMYKHYSEKHRQTKVSVKCCRRQLYIRYVRDHILYHLNSNIFK